MGGITTKDMYHPKNLFQFLFFVPQSEVCDFGDLRVTLPSFICLQGMAADQTGQLFVGDAIVSTSKRTIQNFINDKIPILLLTSIKWRHK